MPHVDQHMRHLFGNYSGTNTSSKTRKNINHKIISSEDDNLLFFTIFALSDRIRHYNVGRLMFKSMSMRHEFSDMFDSIRRIIQREY